MGRRLLLIAVAAGACAPAPEPRPVADGEDPHGTLACAECHQGGLSDREEPAVPAEACTGSGCHADAGPASLLLDGVDFQHRQHGGDAPVELGCAGCHSHDEGTAPLATTTDGCALCHADELEGDEATDCQSCHGQPDHLGFTSQGVALPHENIPWIQGECVRCHYDVGHPDLSVDAPTCVACHEDLAGVTAAGAGQDLHPAHTGVACTACHEEGGHRIVAMSSAVSLDCASCHGVSHDVEVGPRLPPATCNDCHGESHRAEQELVLGSVPGGLEATPSEKFLIGMTCRSCHVGSGRTAGGETVRVGVSASCVSCHRAEYATVLRWWRQGTAERLRRVEAYVRSARSAAGASPSAEVASALARSDSLVALVREAGGEHNLPLTHRMLEAAAAGAAQAGAPGSPPDLGRQPRMGLCGYCHYLWQDPSFTGNMDERFHREVLGVDTERR